MKITYDKTADAIYIYLSDEERNSSYTYLCDPKEVRGMINLDFNKEGRLIGIEVLDAKNKLPAGFINVAINLRAPILFSDAKKGRNGE